jgi:sugar (pentulose or hexulose) kinase
VTLVADIDSSTQSVKVLVCDVATGEVIREGRAAHPGGTEIDPAAWQVAADVAIAAAGGLTGVAGIGGSIAATASGHHALSQIAPFDTSTAGVRSLTIRPNTRTANE